MAVRTDPRFGFKYGWASGDDGWGEDMNTNLQLLMTLTTHLTVEDRNLSTPPVSPIIGDAYIVGPSATGAWSGRENDIAIWWQTPTGASADWLFIDVTSVREGVRAYIKDEDLMVVWKGTEWSIGRDIDIDEVLQRAFDNPKVIDRNLTAPPGSPSDLDTYIPAATAAGDWAGRENDIAVWRQSPGETSASWKFNTPDDGQIAYIKDEEVITAWDGTNWRAGLTVTA